jgi:hypothetical protein
MLIGFIFSLIIHKSYLRKASFLHSMFKCWSFYSITDDEDFSWCFLIVFTFDFLLSRRAEIWQLSFILQVVKVNRLGEFFLLMGTLLLPIVVGEVSSHGKGQYAWSYLLQLHVRNDHRLRSCKVLVIEQILSQISNFQVNIGLRSV